MKHFVQFLTLGFALSWNVVWLSDAARAAGKGKEWMTLENCQLVPNRSNDGDSFHIRANNAEYLVRLYFVDAPETGGVGSPERLIEQARYFGVTVPQAIEIGQNAKTFVQAKLAEPFTVVTRMAEGLGHSNIPRILGFVKAKDGSDLAEQLVANGLARIQGKKTAPPGLSRAEDEVQKLEQLEQEAKQKKLGGWAVSPAKVAASPERGRLLTPVPLATQQTPKPSTPVPTATPPLLEVTPAASLSSGQPSTEKLDVNTATKGQLEHIPGIGPTLAERIIEARPFQSVDDLKKVKGIGSGKRFEGIRPFFK